ncbi:putative membrane protein YadS [Desulfuromonas soudanensis]|uniref:Putative membrane protein YadS n=1 Tax=Desulfuromonas soudanensis TaxID=1603606 RepID=A0A0M4D184_9BACT|nr:putative sulfate exporter family transporter [Desulfuromonas soudanensis]ALC15801.1 putative membrane protein YadS [Desulfuromonas soudanensis]
MVATARVGKVWDSRRAILLAIFIGTLFFLFQRFIGSYFTDPLILSLVAGIAVRALTGSRWQLQESFLPVYRLFIPVGIFFYAVKNLNFSRNLSLSPSLLGLLVLVMLVYFVTIFLLGAWMGQKKTITYLTAAGSAICGASAIAITSPALDAEPDDVSISLLAVASTSLVALFVIFPFLGTLFDLSGTTYALASGSVLQLTGFVKAAVGHMPYLSGAIPASELAALALSVKAGRYLGLLVAIPLLSSLARKRMSLPWTLWVFVGAGLLGTRLSMAFPTFYQETLLPVVQPIYLLSWSIAMAAIGLSADIRELHSDHGVKALIQAFCGCCAAVATFFAGLFVIY